MDRTSEFLSAVTSLSPAVSNFTTRGATGPNKSEIKSSSKAVAQGSKFALAAAAIGKSLLECSERLEQLALLARTPRLFNDEASSIDQLTTTVKNNLEAINQALTKLEQGTATSAYAADEHTSVQSANSSAAIVNNLKQRLTSTTKTFSEVLTVRAQNLKHQNSRRREFESATGTPYRRSGPVLSLPADLDEPSTADYTKLADDPQPELEIVVVQGQDQSDSFFQQRALAVEQVERTMAEIGSMYQRLAGLVLQQDETTRRIDDNINSMAENVDAGAQEIEKYRQSVSTGKWLVFKVAALLMVFALFFIFFIAG